MPAPTSATPPELQTLRCLEVWGGNQALDNGVVMAGLDAWLYARPFRGQVAGGDLHYVSSCAAGMITRVLVADVSGHGEKVAETAAALRRLMRRYVNFADQTQFIQGLNTEFAELTEAGGFATAVAATYYAGHDEFRLCNAGHPRPLWFRARARTWSLMSADHGRSGGAKLAPSPSSSGGVAANIPLGITDQISYDQISINLATGDVVVLYTDSLIEAKGHDGKALGEEGLLRLVQGLDPSDPSEFIHALLGAMPASETGPVSGDDVTVLILRPNGLKPRMTMAVGMKAMRALAGAAFAAMRPGGPPFPWPPSGPLTSLGRLLNRVNSRWGVPRTS